MENIFFKLYPLVPEEDRFILEPAIRSRDWMVNNPHSFKCYPITNCNSFGWDLISPKEIKANWNGNTKKEDLNIIEGKSIADTNFGFGILTTKPGFTFHTSPEWSLQITPIPNYDHKFFTPISAIVETCSLKYPTFISVNMKNTGETIIPAKTPICRLLPIKVDPVLNCQPEICLEPLDFLEYRSWQSIERTLFLNNPEIKKEKKNWQQFYRQIADHPTLKMKEVIKQKHE